jgi:gamma-glutamylcyclotransferase (GGCT)/AIG2-like uncharacterized protein YtfP
VNDRCPHPVIPPSGSTLALFVYGTLMRGQANHRRFCAGAALIRPATIPGRLFHLRAGYPAVAIDPDRILAHGSTSLERDLELARQDRPLPTRPPSPDVSVAPDLVHGELIWFRDGPARLAAIDRLEGFRPDGSGLYDRVLVDAVVARTTVRAWTYVQGRPVGTHLPTGRWTARS